MKGNFTKLRSAREKPKEVWKGALRKREVIKGSRNSMDEKRKKEKNIYTKNEEKEGKRTRCKNQRNQTKKEKTGERKH
ncbi:MAG: hypothetical protein U5K51_01610 [Flavobacteriaceae bacterium]|nr:hypothetical protein [Flavobacteriaceae bacterium]